MNGCGGCNYWAKYCVVDVVTCFYEYSQNDTEQTEHVSNVGRRDKKNILLMQKSMSLCRPLVIRPLSDDGHWLAPRLAQPHTHTMFVASCQRNYSWHEDLFSFLLLPKVKSPLASVILQWRSNKLSRRDHSFFCRSVCVYMTSHTHAHTAPPTTSSLNPLILPLEAQPV